MTSLMAMLDPMFGQRLFGHSGFVTPDRNDCELAMNKRDDYIDATEFSMYAKEGPVVASIITFACVFKLYLVLKIRPANL